MKEITLYLLLTLIFIFRFITTLPVYKNGDHIRIKGSLSTPPTYYSSKQIVNLSGISISLPLGVEINYGDYIVVEGTVIDKKLQKPKIISLEKRNGILLTSRNRILDFYSSFLDRDSAALVGGIVLGDKSLLSVRFWNLLKNTGTAHVVVASGMNVTFLTAFLISTFTIVLKRNLAIPFVIFGIFTYILLTGFQAPIIRASIMCILVFLAQETGRVYFPWRILLLTGLGMLIAVPAWTSDIGFWLTFVATSSIMLFQKRVDEKLKYLPEFFRESLSTSIAAQIGVAPIIFASFGQFNILSPVINALILWIIPIVMFAGSIAGVLSLVSWKLAAPILWLNLPLTTWFAWIVKNFGKSGTLKI